MKVGMPVTDKEGRFNFAAVERFEDDSPKACLINRRLLAGTIGHQDGLIERLIVSLVGVEVSFEQAIETVSCAVYANKDKLCCHKSAVVLGGISGSGPAIWSIRTDTGEIGLQDVSKSGRLEYLGTTANFDVTPYLEEQLSSIRDYSFGRLVYLAQELGKYAAANDPLVSPKFSLLAVGG